MKNNKSGKALIWIILIVLVLLIGAVLYYVFYLSEWGMRRHVDMYYYKEAAKETCELNAYQGFASKEDCENTVKCVSAELAQLIVKEDLSKFVKSMNKGESAESVTIIYMQNNPLIKARLESKSQTCLNSSGYSK